MQGKGRLWSHLPPDRTLLPQPLLRGLFPPTPTPCPPTAHLTTLPWLIFDPHRPPPWPPPPAPTHPSSPAWATDFHPALLRPHRVVLQMYYDSPDLHKVLSLYHKLVQEVIAPMVRNCVGGWVGGSVGGWVGGWAWIGGAAAYGQCLRVHPGACRGRACATRARSRSLARPLAACEVEKIRPTQRVSPRCSIARLAMQTAFSISCDAL